MPKIIILTLFPDIFKGFFSESILARALKEKKVDIELKNLRDWGLGKRKTVDDTPYGGGAGMVLRVDVVAKAIQDIKRQATKDYKRVVSDADQKKIKTQDSKIKTILLTPQGQVFNQKKAQKLTDNMINKSFDLLLVCGHYEGFDERIRNYVDEEISIGDYILTGGELAAAVIVDSVARLIPGVLGKAESHQEESFSVNLNDSRSIRNSKFETQNSKLPRISSLYATG